jgi:hypothetical protein
MDERHDELHSSVHATHPVVGTELTFGSVTDKISAIVLKRKTPIGWFIGFAISFALFQLMLLAITKLVFVGIGMWGVNVPVAWGMDILNFRLVDRHRPRRHADLRHPAAAETGSGAPRSIVSPKR